MSWWRIKNLKTGQVWKSSETPLILVDCVKEVSIPLGHALTHTEVTVESGPVMVDMRTGAIWYEGKPVEVVERPDKLILFRRKVRDGKTGQSLGERAFLGVVSVTGDGLVMQQHGKGWKLKSFSIGVPVSE